MERKTYGCVRLAALVCQSVGALFLVIFCALLLGAVSDLGAFLDTVGLRFVAPMVTALAPCAAAAAGVVTRCEWLSCLGRPAGRRLLGVSLPVQLGVEGLIFALVLPLLLAVSWSAQGKELIDGLGLGGVVGMLILGVAVMAAACVFLHTAALLRVRGAGTDRTAAVACFVAGGVHAVTLLALAAGLACITAEMADVIDDAIKGALFVLLAGFAAADVLYGIVALRADT